MRAMILAAGRGERLRPLTDTLPKPLIPVAGQPLIVHHIRRLAASGINDIVINIAYLAEKIYKALGDGHQFGVTLHYSFEASVLETGGGIFRALPLLGNKPFLVINGDVWTDYPLSLLMALPLKLAHLVLVNNPPHHPDGDFYWCDNHIVSPAIATQNENKLTFSGLGVYHPDLFNRCNSGAFRLAPLLHDAVEKALVTGEHYQGTWIDIGTLERLQQAMQLNKDKKIISTHY